MVQRKSLQIPHLCKKVLKVTKQNQLQLSLFIRCQVLDVNDNAPVFTQLRYQATVVEGSPKNQVVLTVSATDIDTTQEDVSYSLDQEGQQFFTIERRTGEIKTGGRTLDREKTPVLNFTVLASDGKYTGVAGIKVQYIYVAQHNRR